MDKINKNIEKSVDKVKSMGDNLNGNFYSGNVEQGTQSMPYNNESVAQSHENFDNLDKDIIAMLHKGETVEAIKEYRIRKGCDLTTAKEMIEKYIDVNNISNISSKQKSSSSVKTLKKKNIYRKYWIESNPQSLDNSSLCQTVLAINQALVNSSMLEMGVFISDQVKEGTLYIRIHSYGFSTSLDIKDGNKIAVKIGDYLKKFKVMHVNASDKNLMFSAFVDPDIVEAIRSNNGKENIRIRGNSASGNKKDWEFSIANRLLEKMNFLEEEFIRLQN